MQCRNPLRQHVAAQVSRARVSANGSQQHIWISDELQSEAFVRFVRVSRTSKRYGSRVPGPLEAHRRLSKRRMGLASAGATGLPPATDFGALFGAGTLPEHSLRWQPPSLDSGVGYGPPPPPPPPRSLPPWFWKQSSQTVAQGPVPRLQDEPDPAPALVLASKDAFSTLLGTKKELERLSKTDMEPLLDFLQSARDESDASNLLILLRWLRHRSSSASAIDALSTVILDKVKLGTLAIPEFAAAIELLPSIADWKKDPEIRQSVLANFAAFANLAISRPGLLGSRPQHQMVCRSLFQAAASRPKDVEDCVFALQMLSVVTSKRDMMLMDDPLVANALVPVLASIGTLQDLTEDQIRGLASQFNEVLKLSDEPSLLQNLTRSYLLREGRVLKGTQSLASVNFWLRCLFRGWFFHDHAQSKSEILPAWSVYGILADSFEPSDLAQHFAKVPSRHFARALLTGWVPRWKTSSQRAKKTSSSVHSVNPTGVDLGSDWNLRALFEEFDRSNRLVDGNSLVALLQLLQRHRIPYERVLKSIFQTLEDGGIRAHARHGLFVAIYKASSIDIPVELTIAQIAELLDNGHHLRALRVFLNTPDLPLAASQGLLSRLISKAVEDRQMYFAILSRQNRAARLPTSERLDLVQSMTANHICLVRQLAAAIPAFQSLNPREAFRRVWQCYRFLRDHRVPLDVMMSRAMVHAGVIRTLQERLPLPDDRVNFILRWVRQLEGDAVADGLDRWIYSIRHSLLPEMRAQEDSRKRRERSRPCTLWRRKAWTRLRPQRVTREDGTIVYVAAKNGGLDPRPGTSLQDAHDSKLAGTADEGVAEQQSLFDDSGLEQEGPGRVGSVHPPGSVPAYYHISGER